MPAVNPITGRGSGRGRGRRSNIGRNERDGARCNLKVRPMLLEGDAP